MATPYTILDENRHFEIPAAAAAPDTGIWLDAAAAQQKLGWQLKPEGLCQGDVCIPVRDRTGWVADGVIELAGLAKALGRPLAVDADERVAALGTAAATRAASLTSLEAPDFSLPDLAGRMHTLSEHRGKKVLLIAYASW
jgi:hypothetical protein